MNETTAIRNLNALIIGIQRARSILVEQTRLQRDDLAIMHPWLFGDKCPLPILIRAVDGHESGTRKLRAEDYANLMRVVYMKCNVAVSASLADFLPTNDEIADHCVEALETWQIADSTEGGR